MELMHNKKRDELRLLGEKIFDFVNRSSNKICHIDCPNCRGDQRKIMIVRLDEERHRVTTRIGHKAVAENWYRKYS